MLQSTFFSASDDESLHGVIPRSVQDIFNKIGQSGEMDFTVHVSFMELYNEQVIHFLVNSFGV